MPEVKETKAQRVERLKRAKNAWDRFEEIRAFARDGFDSIPPEWLGTYFRTWGIYTQGDGAGVTGGKNGEGKAVPFFMVRIRIPNGLLTSQQARTIADLSDDFGNGVADITVRQNVQLHWVAVDHLPELLERLWAVGLTTTGACGDVARNITGCPLAGVHAHELADVSPLALAIDRELGGNPDFYNLPRKFKITITGCPDWCSYPEINDIAFSTTLRPSRSAGFQPANVAMASSKMPQVSSPVAQASACAPTTSPSNHASTAIGPTVDPASPHSTSDSSTSHQLGFSLRVAGGLSTQPHLAVKLNAFIHWDQVVPVARAIAEVFRESEALRQSREKARLKFLFLEHGWTADSFLAAIEARLGYKLDPAEPEQLPPSIHRDHLGVTPQKQPNLFSVGASVIRGRITPAQIRLAADLADRYGDGHLRATPMQNLLLINIGGLNLPTVIDALNAGGLPVLTSAFVRGTVACTGSEFCKLALTETKSFARWLTEELDSRFPGYQDDLRIHITGCPNSCGQHWIADVGIEGKKMKVDGKMVDAYYFCVGGSVGQIAAIARPIGYRCVSDEVPNAIARLLSNFHAHRHHAEPLQNFLARHTTEHLRSILSGQPASQTEVALRDLPADRVPHSIEDRP
ncbi:MAG TPA: nitrite reductase [Candidatus Eisenbacteria bacterium]|nr:nitrite reductase [Candidatus Eisenbacteria bacterium]